MRTNRANNSNAIELLIAILALVKGDIDIVQASMIGSILSNVLLVLGMSYFAGGLRFHEQQYGIVGAQMHISLLGITVSLEEGGRTDFSSRRSPFRQLTTMPTRTRQTQSMRYEAQVDSCLSVKSLIIYS